MMDHGLEIVAVINRMQVRVSWSPALTMAKHTVLVPVDA